MLAGEKGRELERAVHAIEDVILRSSPNLREQSFKIEPRKIVTVDGVRHEIDLFVTVGIAKGYHSTFIFECKNWEEAVGKNEIIVFSEKIDAVSAQHGYVVAKSFTKDAIAQGAKDARITLLTATAHDITTTITPEAFHITAPASAKPDTTFRAAGSTGQHLDPIDVCHQHACMNGKDVLLADYLNAWVEEVYHDRLLTFNTAYLPEGTHPMTATAERTFTPGACVINGRDMASVHLDVTFGVKIVRPAVISDYEVSTRGRVIRLETVHIHDLAIKTAFVKAYNQ